MILPAELMTVHEDDDPFDDGTEKPVQTYQPEYLAIAHAQKRSFHFLTA